MLPPKSLRTPMHKVTGLPCKASTSRTAANYRKHYKPLIIFNISKNKVTGVSHYLSQAL